MKNLRLKLLSLIVSVLSVLCFSNFKKEKIVIDFNIINKEVELFIKKAKVLSVLEGKYNVYALRFGSESNGYCITLGYTSNLIHISDLKQFKYYFKLNNELILVDYPSLMKQKFILINSPFKLIKDRGVIRKKVSEEPFLGAHCGYVCCYNDDEVIKKFYDSDEFIPNDKAIFKYKSEGTLIKVDSTTLKKILNEGK